MNPLTASSATQAGQGALGFSKVHAVLAALVFVVAMAFTLFVGFSIEGLIVLGVGMTMAIVVFFLGLRRGT